MKCSIYKIFNTINDKLYIGQTWVDLEKRFGQHKGDGGHCIKLKNAFDKYGRENFHIEELTTCLTQKEADEIETNLIKEYNTIKHGYNLREGGSRGLHSEETINNMRIAQQKRFSAPGFVHHNLGKKDSDEVRANKSKAREGMVFSETHKLNISKVKTGITLSEETKRKIGESQKGRKATEATLEKMRARVDTVETRLKKSLSATGRILTEEDKQKMSEAKKGRTWKLIDGKRVWSKINK